MYNANQEIQSEIAQLDLSDSCADTLNFSNRYIKIDSQQQRQNFTQGGEGGIRTRGGGFSPRTHLAGEPNRPLWHLPVGGGRGIRTHDGFLHTCFQDRRLKPLGHPSRLRENPSQADGILPYPGAGCNILSPVLIIMLPKYLLCPRQFSNLQLTGSQRAG